MEGAGQILLGELRDIASAAKRHKTTCHALVRACEYVVQQVAGDGSHVVQVKAALEAAIALCQALAAPDATHRFVLARCGCHSNASLYPFYPVSRVYCVVNSCLYVLQTRPCSMVWSCLSRYCSCLSNVLLTFVIQVGCVPFRWRGPAAVTCCDCVLDLR